MNKLVYVLSNGETVNTMNEAKASGLEYKTDIIEIPETPIKLTEKQKANRKTIAK